MTHVENVKEMLEEIRAFGNLSKHEMELKSYLAAVKVELQRLQMKLSYRAMIGVAILEDINFEIKDCEEAIELGEKA